MLKKEKVQFIISTLDELYPNPEIPLKHTDPFTLLAAVILSGQSTDKRVNQVTPALFKLADTPQKMAILTPAKIERIIKPCGLGQTKSKSIYNSAKIILEKHSGKVPDSYGELEALPGVGHKTASVIMSQAFGVSAFPVDTHIHRLMRRWRLSSGKNVVQTEKDCKRLFPEEKWNILHLQIVYFGREYCPARGHKPEQCPICRKIN